LSRRAPDFWSWRKAVLRFQAESPDLVQTPALITPSLQLAQTDLETEPLPPPAELEAEIATLTAKDPNAPSLANLYDRLGRVYAQRIRQGLAQNLEREQEKAIAAFNQAIDRYHAQDQKLAEMKVLGQSGNFFDAQSLYLEAIYCNEKGLEISREIGDRVGEANSLVNLGNAYSSLGDQQKAITFFQQSLEIYREIGNRYGEALSLMGLGNAYKSLGQPHRAITFYQQSLEIYREIGDRQRQAASLMGLGNAHKLLKEYQKSLDFYQQALEIVREIGDLDVEGRTLSNLGVTCIQLKRYSQAIELFQQALQLHRRVGNRHLEANALYNMAGIYVLIGHPWPALQHYQQAKKIFQDLGLEHELKICSNAIYSLNQTIPVQQARRAPEIVSTRSPTSHKSWRSRIKKPHIVFGVCLLVGLAIALLLWWFR